MPGSNCRVAFTLSEILITLGVIGIVAALTIPALITKYEKNVTVTRLKKFYSIMSSAIKISEDENGEMASWDFPMESYDSEMIIFFRRYYVPYLNIASECAGVGVNCFTEGHENYVTYELSGKLNHGNFLANYLVKLADGSYVFFLPNTPSGYIWMFVDINGYQKPNKVGRDIFVFDIFGYPGGLRQNYRLKFWGHEVITDNLYSNDNYGCSKSSPEFAGFNCGEVIFRNGWKIPDDYPW